MPIPDTRVLKQKRSVLRFFSLDDLSMYRWIDVILRVSIIVCKFFMNRLQDLLWNQNTRHFFCNSITKDYCPNPEYRCWIALVAIISCYQIHFFYFITPSAYCRIYSSDTRTNTSSLSDPISGEEIRAALENRIFWNIWFYIRISLLIWRSILVVVDEEKNKYEYWSKFPQETNFTRFKNKNKKKIFLRETQTFT